jgi:hypothetical protein
MDIPYKLEIKGNKCLEPQELLDEIKSKYNLNKEEMNKLIFIINEKDKSI